MTNLQQMVSRYFITDGKGAGLEREEQNPHPCPRPPGGGSPAGFTYLIKNYYHNY